MAYIDGGLVEEVVKYQLTVMFVDVALTRKTIGPTGLAENLKKLQMLGTAKMPRYCWNCVELCRCTMRGSTTIQTGSD